MKIKKVYSALLIIIMVFNLFSFNAFALEASSLSKQEIVLLSEFDSKLCQNNDIKKLKELNLLDSFIVALQEEYRQQKQADFVDRISQLDRWGISINNSIGDIKTMSQQYLKRISIEIDSVEFDNYVRESLQGDANGIYKKAVQDLEFGPLYAYMCIYYEFLMGNDKYTNALLKESQNISEISIEKLLDIDFKQNFVDTQIPIILREFLSEKATRFSAPWPAMNGTNIQWYARQYSNSELGNSSVYFHIEDGDCTNFVSQALFYGGLYKTYYSSDQTASGYVQTDSRWFYFNNNSTVGHSVSTSWVRVRELYTYLSPHYATYEAKANTNVNPYLNKGFILQGRNFFGAYHHSVIVTIRTPGVYEYCAHTNVRHDEPIGTFYDGFYKCRVIQTY